MSLDAEKKRSLSMPPHVQPHSSRVVLMMSTIVIQPLAPVFGTPVVNYTLQAYLKAGWTIYFIVGFKPKPVDNELAKQLRISWFGGSLLHTLRIVGESVRKVGFFVRAVWWVIVQVLFFTKGFRILRRHKVDLIYTWDVNAAPAGWMLAKNRYSESFQATGTSG